MLEHYRVRREEDRIQRNEEQRNTAEEEYVDEEKAAEDAPFSCLESSQVCWSWQKKNVEGEKGRRERCLPIFLLVYGVSGQRTRFPVA